MTRMAALLLSLVLVGATAAPATAAPATAAPADVGPMPPPTSVVPPAAGLPVAPELVRLGRLRIPGIDLNVSVYRWSCRARDLPNVALRWRCSGANNQFIVGHAYGVFRPYHLAWKHDRFKKGMRATYTDPSGRVTRYELAWVRKVRANYIWKGKTGDQWAWNATSKPSITLQTCWGSTNKYRIVARWVKA